MFKINKFNVQPLSSKKENFYLLLAFIILLFFAGYLLKIRHREAYIQKINSNEISAFSGLNNIEASIYSDVLNSFVEISILREEVGEVPNIENLEKEEIPPYFKDELWQQKGAIEWFSFEHDNSIHYLGISSTENVGSFMIVVNNKDIQESEVFYTKEKLSKKEILNNFEIFESIFKKIVPYTGEEERKKFKGV
ncbi:MAG: hypothetical protein IJG31_02905 [Fusobacterium sp.]|nr:hypothetical protein [Fusobacterium sp.]